MKKINIFLLSSLILPWQYVFGYGSGISTFPMSVSDQIISAEGTGITSQGGGVGAQARYTRKVNKDMYIDAGLGFSGGERSGRFFAGLDYEFFPDHKKQPRISGKINWENASEFGVRRNVLTYRPMISKGFTLGKSSEIFPFLSVPFGVSLDSDGNTYRSVLSVNFGLSGKLPFQNLKHITGSIEGIAGIDNTHSGVFAALSFPIH